MSMHAFMGKLQELKAKMAELESMEESLPGAEAVEEVAEESAMPGEEVSSAPEAVASEEEKSEGLGEEEILDLFGKKKKPAPKASGVMIAVGSHGRGKPMGKHK